MNNIIIKSTLSITMIGILVKIFGFLKQVITAYYFGANFEMDAFFLASGFISNLAYLVCTTLSITFLTMYIATKTNSLQSETNEFISSVILLYEIITFILGVLIFIFAPQISRILAPKYVGIQLERVSYFIHLFSFVIMIQVLITVNGTILNANKKFIPQQINGLIQSIVIIGFILLLHAVCGIQALAVSFIVAYLCQFIFLLFYAQKYFTFRFVNPLKDKRVHQMVKLILPLLVGYGAIEINQIIDKIITSGLGEGVVSALSYAQTIASSISQLLIASIVTVVFTYFTESVEQCQYEETKHLMQQSIIMVLIVTIPVSVWCIFSAKEIISVIYGHGRFEANAIQNTAFALIGYGFGFVAQGLREVLVKVHYAFQDTKRPTQNSLITIVVNILFSIILSRFIGIFGVTIATSISGLVSVFLFSITIKKHMVFEKSVYDYQKLLKLFIATFVMCLLILIVKSLTISTNIFLVLIIEVVISSCAFVVMLYILKLNEMVILINKIKVKFKSKK